MEKQRNSRVYPPATGYPSPSPSSPSTSLPPTAGPRSEGWQVREGWEGGKGDPGKGRARRGCAHGRHSTHKNTPQQHQQREFPRGTKNVTAARRQCTDKHKRPRTRHVVCATVGPPRQPPKQSGKGRQASAREPGNAEEAMGEGRERGGRSGVCATPRRGKPQGRARAEVQVAQQGNTAAQQTRRHGAALGRGARRLLRSFGPRHPAC